MIIDFSEFDPSTAPPVVIIGSGPAGVTLAKALSDKNVKSLILEAGGLDLTDRVQETCRGEVIGDEYWELEFSRLKYFGGTSNHWTGVCRHLDAEDFQARPDVPGYIGWPISKDDLEPYREAASRILQVPVLRDRELGGALKEVEFALSPPVRFGNDQYRAFFEKSSHAHVCLNAPVLSLEAANGRITKVHIANIDGGQLTLTPGLVVLCAGGIDNSRLLLWSNEQSAEPIVQNTDVLGKYWFEHPHNIAGEVVASNLQFDYSFPWGMAFLSPTGQAQKEYGILNACLRVLHDRRESTLKSAARTAICATRPLSTNILSRFGEELNCSSTVELVWEQEPRAGNRIALSTDEKDGFGVPRPVLHWAKSELDYRTAKVSMELLGRYLQDNGLGVLRVYDHIIGEEHHPAEGWMAGHHHMGGTRMAASAKDGIVDKNLKIFGMDNGYVLGSSVFPHGGHANPTYSIVQLSLRLADHVASKMRG